MECMPSIGAPMSTVLIPVLLEMMGPTIKYRTTDGGSAWRIVLDDEVLDGDSCLLSNYSDYGGRCRIGGISLADISLDNNSLVDFDAMVALVLVGIVGVQPMSHIGRNHKRPLHHLLKAVRTLQLSAEQLEYPFQSLVDDVGAGALGRFRTALLVVEQGNQVDELSGVLCLQQGVHRVERREQVVEAGRADVLVVETEVAGWVGVREVEVEVEDGVTIYSQIAGDEVDEAGVVLSVDTLLLLLLVLLGFGLHQLPVNLGAENGAQVGLCVRLKLGTVRTQMDGQVGYLEQCLLGIPELDGVRVSVVVDHFSSESEGAVEPGMPQSSSVSGNTCLMEVIRAHFGDGSQPEAWTVGMCSDNLEAYGQHKQYPNC